jgi:hypothetical protein
MPHIPIENCRFRTRYPVLCKIIWVVREIPDIPIWNWTKTQSRCKKPDISHICDYRDNGHLWHIYSVTLKGHVPCHFWISWLNFGVSRHFQQYFSYIMATSFSGGRSWSTRREPPTMNKQLVTSSLVAASRVHLYCNLQSRARTHAVLVIGLYELLGNPTT